MADEVLPGMPAPPEPVVSTPQSETQFHAGDESVMVGAQTRGTAYEVPSVNIPAPQWQHIKDCLKIHRDYSVIWLGLAFAWLGIAATSAIAYATLPEGTDARPATTTSVAVAAAAGLSHSTRVVILTIAILTGVLFVVSFAAYFTSHDAMKQKLTEIGKLMHLHEPPPAGDS